MEFVVVRYCKNYIDAHLVQMRLEQENIKCWLRDENVVSLWGNAVGKIKLVVPAVQAERATEIIKLWDTQRKNHYSCPYCGSHEVELITDVGIEERDIYMCFECGAEFDQPIENIPPQ